MPQRFRIPSEEMDYFREKYFFSRRKLGLPAEKAIEFARRSVAVAVSLENPLRSGPAFIGSHADGSLSDVSDLANS